MSDAVAQADRGAELPGERRGNQVIPREQIERRSGFSRNAQSEIGDEVKRQVAAFLKREEQVQHQRLGFGAPRQERIDRSRQELPHPRGATANRRDLARQNLVAHGPDPGAALPVPGPRRLLRATPAISSGRKRWMSA